MHSLKHHSELIELAKKYVWWESFDWARAHPTVFLASVMNLASGEDMFLLYRLLDKALLRQVLKEAPPGYFSYRSWDYWHLKLGWKRIPPLPKRKLV